MINIDYLSIENIKRGLQERVSSSVDFIVFVTGALFPERNLVQLKEYLEECIRVLQNEGLLFVQGRPDYLPELGVFLDQRLNFKYWIAIESLPRRPSAGLPSVHAGMLLFSKGNRRFNIQRTRFPHQRCAACGRYLKDWGGKTHLMHPEGYVISDVWRDLPQENNYTQISEPVIDTVLRMLDFRSEVKKTLFESLGNDLEIRGLFAPAEGLASQNRLFAEPAVQYSLPGFIEKQGDRVSVTQEVGGRLFDVVHLGDAVEILKQFPDNSIDLAFADPPYNLDKAYSVYDDERDERRYIDWCNTWLKEYVCVLKPTGALYVLNLPRWTMYHASFLNQHLYFQNWIVWEALSEPRGKLMPAHYGLLYYTKHPTDFTYNYDQVGQLDARFYCLRSSCIRKRKAVGEDDKEKLTDIWWDIHRIKHKRDRDYHPCQLPEALMERIIRLSTNEGDIVLDALSGTGTTAATAVKLGRRYVAIDIDKYYVGLTREKIAEVERQGYVSRESLSRPKQKYSKKELQLELRDLAVRLGRLPTPDDVRKLSKYDVRVFYEIFPTWGKAIKAAKLEVDSDGTA
ncbi:MAG: DNA methyltransferase [Chloroflexota bacterium]